jgi:ABC-type sugar transport system ATPase subunit
VALLVVDDVHKRFGGVHALRGARLRVERPGSVHALVGENGSGKSTLLRILAGQLRPDRGEVRLDGEFVELSTPVRALRRGIVTVTQETTLAPDLTVAENVFLGHRMARGHLGIRWGATARAARAVLEQLELDLDPGRVVRRLRPDQQQMVEVARAISMDARILVLDEPTSSLTDDEVQALFAVVRRLRERGVATIFVSHRLGETFALADEVTVLRDGRTVGEAPIAAYDRRSLVAEMVGAAAQPAAHHAPAAHRAARALLSVRGLSVGPTVRDVSLDVHAGEVVGLAGLVGSGRSELLEAVFGLRQPSAGEIRLDGEPVRLAGVRDAVRHGLGLVPADRKGQGLVPTMSVRENLLMAATAGRPRLGRPAAGGDGALVDRTLEGLRIRTRSPQDRVATLSGGNQQKVVLGKWLAAGARVLLLDEPTRGVDVGAKAEIHRLLAREAAGGMGILLSSSETPELLAACDRVVVMFRGRVTASLRREDATEAAVARYAMGHGDERD